MGLSQDTAGHPFPCAVPLPHPSTSDVLMPDPTHPCRLIYPSGLIKAFSKQSQLDPEVSPTSTENSIFSLITFSSELSISLLSFIANFLKKLFLSFHFLVSCHLRTSCHNPFSAWTTAVASSMSPCFLTPPSYTLEPLE